VADLLGRDEPAGAMVLTGDHERFGNGDHAAIHDVLTCVLSTSFPWRAGLPTSKRPCG
jgi:hypothetical protein